MTRAGALTAPSSTEERIEEFVSAPVCVPRISPAVGDLHSVIVGDRNTTVGLAVFEPRARTVRSAPTASMTTAAAASQIHLPLDLERALDGHPVIEHELQYLSLSW